MHGDMLLAPAGSSMTVDDFRRIALSMPEASEGAHMGHPDFRVGGKIFATIRPDEGWGMVALTPEQQREFVHDAPKMFAAVKGGWGLQGATNVRLERADGATVRRAMETAWSNRAPRKIVERAGGGGGPSDNLSRPRKRAPAKKRAT